MNHQVDVAIIGAGTAGLAALAEVRRAGASFVLVDGGELGTTCARVGCMPSKALLQVAEDYARRKLFERFGIEGAESLQLSAGDALEHVRDLRDLFVDRVLEGTTDDMGDEFIAAHARFESPGVLIAGQHRIEASGFVIATGSRALVPEPWSGLGARVLTTDTVFELQALPATLAVIGLGAVGLELGQAFSRLGVQVTGIERLARPGGLTDTRVADQAVQILAREFDLWLGEDARLEAAGDALRVQAGEQAAAVECALVALGRRPNLDRLGLDRLGLTLDGQGVLACDPHTLQVADTRLFLAGDVTGHSAILHEAADEGRIAGANALADTPRPYPRRVPLRITFTDPALFSVGRIPADQTPGVAVGETGFGPVGRALIMGRNRGLLRVYANRADARLIGAECVGPKGEHLAHLLALALQRQLTVGELLAMPFYHPTVEEALQAALRNLAAQLDDDAIVGGGLSPA